MKKLNYSKIAFTLTILLSSGGQASTIARYNWSDTQGFIPVSNTCIVHEIDKTALHIAQKPGAELNSFTKIKGQGLLGGLMQGSLLDRSIINVKDLQKDGANYLIQVVSVPNNAIQPNGIVRPSKRGDEGTIAKESLQDIGDFVIEVLTAPALPVVAPFPVKESYWQAAMNLNNYTVLNCGDTTKPTKYLVFDVYDSKGISPIAQVGVSAAETKIFEVVNVMTPDEANQDAIGEALADPSEYAESEETDGANMPIPDTPKPGGIVPGANYLVCTAEKSVSILDKDLKPIDQINQFSSIVPNQSWNEKEKSAYIEVQYFNGKDVLSAWLPRAIVQTKEDCAIYQSKIRADESNKGSGRNNNGSSSKGDNKNDSEAVDYSQAPLDSKVSKADCCKFPTKQRPTRTYLEGKTRFRAARSGGRRLHAGVDLYRVKGDAVMAVASGRVIRGHYYFYQGVFAVEVKHPQFIARYGEVLGNIPKGIWKGNNIVAGQTVGLIGKVNSGCCTPMLHFELYKGTSQGSLTRYRTPPYDRRPDVMDPTPFIRKWEKIQFGKSY